MKLINSVHPVTLLFNILEISNDDFKTLSRIGFATSIVQVCGEALEEFVDSKPLQLISLFNLVC